MVDVNIDSRSGLGTTACIEIHPGRDSDSHPSGSTISNLNISNENDENTNNSYNNNNHNNSFPQGQASRVSRVSGMIRLANDRGRRVEEERTLAGEGVESTGRDRDENNPSISSVPLMPATSISQLRPGVDGDLLETVFALIEVKNKMFLQRVLLFVKMALLIIVGITTLKLFVLPIVINFIFNLIESILVLILLLITLRIIFSYVLNNASARADGTSSQTNSQSNNLSSTSASPSAYYSSSSSFSSSLSRGSSSGINSNDFILGQSNIEIINFYSSNPDARKKKIGDIREMLRNSLPMLYNKNKLFPSMTNELQTQEQEQGREQEEEQQHEHEQREEREQEEERRQEEEQEEGQGQGQDSNTNDNIEQSLVEWRRSSSDRDDAYNITRHAPRERKRNGRCKKKQKMKSNKEGSGSFNSTLLSNSSTLIEDSDMKEIESSLCVACLEEEKCIVLVPCGHMCLCIGCSSRLKSDTCPLCREDVIHKQYVWR